MFNCGVGNVCKAKRRGPPRSLGRERVLDFGTVHDLPVVKVFGIDCGAAGVDGGAKNQRIPKRKLAFYADVHGGED